MPYKIQEASTLPAPTLTSYHLLILNHQHQHHLYPVLLMASPPPSPRAQGADSTCDWASLDLFDCLGIISKKLQSHGFDYVSFRSVCKTWRSAAPKVKFAPLLMFPICPITGTLRFVAISDDRPFSMVVPEVRNKVLCGLTRGMLALMDQDLCMCLLNPFTKVAFELPPATPEMALLSGRSVAREAGRWVNRPIHGPPVRFEIAIELAEFPRLFIREVTLSSPPTSSQDCIVMAILAASNKVAYCKLGEHVWNLVDTHLPEDVRSITYYKNKAYIIDIAGNIATSDVGSLPLTVVRERSVPMLTYDRRAFRLLESPMGDLLKVTLVILKKWEGDHYKYHYEVHKLVEGEEGLAWSRLEDIGEDVLFISRFYSCHFSGTDVRGCKGNHLYFSEASVCAIESIRPELLHVEIVNVTDGQKELVPCHWTMRRSELISWFKPDLMS